MAGGWRAVTSWPAPFRTVAHLGAPNPDGTPGNKHDKMDVRDENLAALCQRCHLNYDRDEHLANAAATRRRRREELGQMPLGIAEEELL